MQQSIQDRNREEWLKHNQGNSAITVDKRKFALQIYNNLLL